MRKFLKFTVYFLSALIICATLFYFIALKPESAPEHQVFINAHVLTMDNNNTSAEAIALEGDKIVAIGSNDTIKKLINKKTVVHDLQGKTLMPGFIDAHSHFPGIGLGNISVDLNSPPIGNIHTIDDIKKRLSEAASKKSAGQWLIGFGYDDSLLEEKRHVSRDDLDAISTEHPIYLMHVSGHFGVANSLALELSGINEQTPDIEGGVYVKDANGKLTGLLEETARLKTAELAFDLSFFQFLEMIEQGSNEYLQAGVTTAQSGLTSAMFIQGLNFAKLLGYIPQNIVVWPDMASGEKWLNGEFNPDKFQTDNFTIAAVKLVSDGSIQGYTGYLNEAYFKHNHDHGDQYRGYPTMAQEELNNRVLALHKAGKQVAVHANGDAAIDAVIEAVAKAQQQYPREDPRHIVVHAQMATQPQLEKMKAVGLTPSFFSAHTYYWGDRHRDIFLGPERAAKISPTATAKTIGLRFTTHLDTPVVPMSPLMAAWATANRTTSSGKALGSDEKVSVMDALRSLTIDAAWQSFLEDRRGSIEIGKKADLIILDKNPLNHAEDLHQIKVLATFINGVEVFSAKK